MGMQRRYLVYGLLGWVLWVQSSALPTDNPTMSRVQSSRWYRSLTLPTTEACQHEQQKRSAERNMVIEDRVVIRVHYRCVEEPQSPNDA